jgi:basic amino acid/polyamine antiporter, APA family
MSFVRSIGKFGLAALIVNSIIGSGIFGIPTELIRAVGRASPLAMVLSGFAAAIIMACYTEVASQFKEAGGAYLYTRTAFGRFAGMQSGWFLYACFLVAAAASANLFVNYLAGILPWVSTALGRTIVMVTIVAVPTGINYLGVRSGTWLSTLFCIAKLLPLLVLIALGLFRFGQNATMLPVGEIAAPGVSGWLSALLLLAFSYSGFEFALTPGGEVKDPRRTVPVAMACAFLVVVATYTLIQFVTVATLGNTPSARPLADAATILIGRGGAEFITITAMCSTYGFISAVILSAPRLTYSLAERGDFFPFFGAVHPKHRTPHISILVFGALLVLISVTGSFRFAVAVGSGALLVNYGFVCASLIRLRNLRPSSDAMRIPFGPVLAVIGVLITVALLSRLQARETLLLALTAIIAASNWWWVTHKKETTEIQASAAD